MQTHTQQHSTKSGGSQTTQNFSDKNNRNTEDTAFKRSQDTIGGEGVAEAGTAFKDTVSALGTKMEGIKDQALEFVQKEAGNLGKFSETAVKKLGGYAAECETMIRKRPIGSIALAAAVGALAAGFIFRPSKATT